MKLGTCRQAVVERVGWSGQRRGAAARGRPARESIGVGAGGSQLGSQLDELEG